eukprot:89200-Rhodomonas_salina.4
MLSLSTAQQQQKEASTKIRCLSTAHCICRQHHTPRPVPHIAPYAIFAQPITRRIARTQADHSIR